MDELLEVANFFVEAIAPMQPSVRVSKQLTERNLRYYINQGLVDPPIGKDGLSAIYGYRHLLQLISLKRLQASYLPVKKIAELINGKSDDSLHCIAVDQLTELQKQTDNPALSFLNAISVPQNNENQIDQVDFSPLSASIREPSDKNKKPLKKQSLSWDRYKLADGIEIHIRNGQSPKNIKSKIKRAIDDFLNSL